MKMDNLEKNKGRIPLWLNPEDILFLLNEWRKIPKEANENILHAWSNIAFRASTALHKNGVKNEPNNVLDSDKYYLIK